MHAEQAEGTQLLGQLAGRDLCFFEPVGDVRPDLVVAVLTHGVADRPFLVVEQVVDREELQRSDGKGLWLRHGLLLNV